MRLSPAVPITLAVGAALGALGGAAFLWATPRRAWELLTAAFLWALIAAAGTTIARCHVERLRRGEWLRGLGLAAAQSLPPTAGFLLAAAAVGAPVGPDLLALAFGAACAVALTTAALGVLLSPFSS